MSPPIVCVSSKSHKDAVTICNLIEDKIGANLQPHDCSYGGLKKDYSFRNAYKVIVCVPCAERILIDDPFEPDDYKTALQLAHTHIKRQFWMVNWSLLPAPDDFVMIILFRHHESAALNEAQSDELFWPGLESTLLPAQPNLRTYAKDNRFLSIENEFNQAQRDAISKFVEKPIPSRWSLFKRSKS